jgi:uncharacterized protein YeaO (DUF488 family)
VKKALKIRSFQIGSPRRRGEGLRVGTVRFLPRGVLKKDYARLDYFDVWLPALAPSRSLMAWVHCHKLAEHWQKFAERYEREMAKHTDSRQSLLLIAKLAQNTPISIGCYCIDESCCHRSLLLKLIKRVALNKL